MIPITKPTLPPFEQLRAAYEELFQSGMLTNHKYAQAFESKVKNLLGVKHVIAVSTCTAGLMLSMKAMKLKGEVILPSFTFSATGHAVMWNGLQPVMVDIEPDHFTIDPEKVREAITPRTSAILAVHMFGHPAKVRELQEIASDHKLRLIYDAAHAFGSKLGNKYVGGFGDAEVFSCSPTKLMTTGEGGIVATNDDEIARVLRFARNYGDPGDYNCQIHGINARMSEFHAILGLATLDMLEQNVEARQRLVALYKKGLQDTPGISYQSIAPGVRSTFKDFSLTINPKEFGMDRDKLHDQLLFHGIQTKRYFYPPLHLQDIYADHKHRHHALPVTAKIGGEVLSVPLYSHMPEEEVRFITTKIKEAHSFGGSL